MLLQLVVFGVLLLLAGPATYLAISSSLRLDRDLYLRRMASQLAREYVAEEPALGEAGQPARCLPRPVPPGARGPAATHRPRHMLIWEPSSGVRCSDGEREPLAPEAMRQALETGDPVFADVRWSAEVLRLVAWPFRAPDRTRLVMEVGTSFLVIEGVLRKGVVFLVGLEIGALVLLVGGSWVLTRRALEPIDRMIRQVEQIDEANLAERLPDEPRADQVGRLATVVNRMLDRLERAFEAQSRFSSDVAHEIRSPLTALRGEIEVALRRQRSPEEYRQVLEECLEEVLRLSRLAEDLMSLARADAGTLGMCWVEVDLRNLARAVAGRFRSRAGDKNIRLRLVGGSDPVSVEGDLDLLDRVVANLVDNAIIHSPPLGEIRIRLDGGAEEARIAVEDDGPGIPPEHLPRIFDRFYRVDQARSRDRGGTGLGLSIVRQIVELHQGSVDVDSSPGRGSAFRVRLPKRHSASG